MRPWAVFAAGLTAMLAGVEPAFATGTPVIVPEPSSLTLLGVGIAAGALGIRWIRRR